MSYLLSVLIPGAGLILSGRVIVGLIWGLLFAIAANCAILSWAILPAEFSPGFRGVALLLVGVFFLASGLIGNPNSIPTSSTPTRQKTGLSAQQRRVAMAELVRAMEEGASADDAARTLRDAAETDLHVAFRLAQYADFSGNSKEATNAWERLRRLDRHRVYSRANGGIDNK